MTAGAAAASAPVTESSTEQMQVHLTARCLDHEGRHIQDKERLGYEHMPEYVEAAASRSFQQSQLSAVQGNLKKAPKCCSTICT